MALINSISHGFQMFSDIGIGPSLVQHPRGLEPSFRNTAFTIQACRALFLGTLLAVSSPALSAVFSTVDASSAQLSYLMPVAAIPVALGGLTSTSVATLTRAIAAKKLLTLNLLPAIASVLVMVAWAFVWPSVWALLAGNFVNTITRVLMSHAANPLSPDRFGWDKQASREMFKFGRWVFASTALTFLLVQGDRIVLGSFVPLTQLGVYSVALSIAGFPLSLIQRLSSSIAFPLLSRRQADLPELLEMSLKGRGLLLPASGAFYAALAVTSPVFFQTLYDTRYAGASPICQLLIIPLWISALSCIIDGATLALGRSRVGAISSLAGAVGIPLSVLGHLLFSMAGFVLGQAVGRLASLLVIIVCLPSRRCAVAYQSVLISSVFFALVCVLSYCSEFLSGQARSAFLVASSLTVVLATSIYVFRKATLRH